MTNGQCILTNCVPCVLVTDPSDAAVRFVAACVRFACVGRASDARRFVGSYVAFAGSSCASKSSDYCTLPGSLSGSSSSSTISSFALSSYRK
jgi:hypothetical protein